MWADCEEFGGGEGRGGQCKTLVLNIKIVEKNINSKPLGDVYEVK